MKEKSDLLIYFHFTISFSSKYKNFNRLIPPRLCNNNCDFYVLTDLLNNMFSLILRYLIIGLSNINPGSKIFSLQSQSQYQYQIKLIKLSEAKVNVKIRIKPLIQVKNEGQHENIMTSRTLTKSLNDHIFFHYVLINDFISYS